MAAAVAGWWAWSAYSASKPEFFEAERRQLTYNGHILHSVISPNGHLLANAVGESGVNQAITLRRIGAPPLKTMCWLLPPDPQRIEGMTFSPDSRSLYFVTKASSGDFGKLSRASASAKDRKARRKTFSKTSMVLSVFRRTARNSPSCALPSSLTPIATNWWSHPPATQPRACARHQTGFGKPGPPRRLVGAGRRHCLCCLRSGGRAARLTRASIWFLSICGIRSTSSPCRASNRSATSPG